MRIRDIAYQGEFKNEHLPIKFSMLPPTISKLLAVSSSSVAKTSEAVENAKQSEEPEVREVNGFGTFASFMANNVTYLVPLDSDRFRDAVITEELLNDVMNGRQKSVLRYDFSLLEEEGE